MSSTLELHLKSAGYSLTKPRRLVFESLQSSLKPLTMQQLYRSLSRQVNRTTVYRVVALFESLKIIQVVNIGWKYQLELTDQFLPHHHHLSCSRCHITVSFDEPAGFNRIIERVAEANGFWPTDHSLEIKGLCSRCRAL